MATNVKEYSFKSTSGLADIYAKSYAPAEGEIKGVIQIAHGMAEHHERYEWFAGLLCDAGYAVFINDHLGHGKSVTSDSELGFFGDRDGYLFLVDDMHLLTGIAKKEYPGKPFILFGHSMGSFLARLYTEMYGKELTAAVYCGTAGSNPAADMGVALINVIEKAKGNHFRSSFINNIAFGTYNKRTEQRTPFDWLSRDNAVVDKYIADKYCGFLFTTAGYRDLMKLLKAVNRSDWYTAVPADLPIYLIAGAEDPVGAYGKGVTEVYNTLLDSLHTDVTIKLYPGDRHEIHNELDKETVVADLIAWIDSKI